MDCKRLLILFLASALALTGCRADAGEASSDIVSILTAD